MARYYLEVGGKAFTAWPVKKKQHNPAESLTSDTNTVHANVQRETTLRI